jgi:transcriptional regulator
MVDLLPGTLDMLILKGLSIEPMHGFGVARWIERVTDDGLTIEEGALYPALHRMEKRGWLASSWRTTENRRRAKYYRVTRAGSRELAVQIAKWEGSAMAVSQVLRAE